MGNILNIFIDNDRDFSLAITQYSDYCHGSGTIMPFTGTEYHAQIRTAKNAATITLSLTVDVSAIGSGVITLESLAAANIGIAPATYYWDLLEIDSGGGKTQLLEGKAIVTGTVTREP
jgi:hypothetical protein